MVAWVRANGPALLGVGSTTTGAELEAHLGDVATYLSGLGPRLSDPGRLIAYDVARITGSGRLDGFVW